MYYKDDQWKTEAGSKLLGEFTWNNQNIFEMEEIHFLNVLKYVIEKEIISSGDAFWLYLKKKTMKKSEDVTNMFDDEDLKDNLPF